ncbi:helix-turn-helix domain-containing protein [Nonomuraea fuscirosea]|uniref:helix-turn-helix domain-containing protein n=1 Tax=Nonomuraea fuscirosea TaxID=1291556 RepID=UPI0033FCB99E
MRRLPPRRPGRTNFWDHLSELERRTLVQVGVARRVHVNETLPVRDGPGIAIVTEGAWVRLQAGNARTSRSVIDLAAPGDLISALHPTDPANPQWPEEATDIYGVVLARGVILDVAQEMIPIILGDLPYIPTLIRRIQNDQLHFAWQLQAGRRLKIDIRLARLLLGLLHRFGEKPVGQHNVLMPPLSQGDLAAWIGASETSVGRVLKRWRCEGLVRTGYSTVAITDHKVLRAIADSPTMPYAKLPTTVGEMAAGYLNLGRTRSVPVPADLPPGLHVRGADGHLPQGPYRGTRAQRRGDR